MAGFNINVTFSVSDIDGNDPGEWFDFTNAGNSEKEILSCVHCLLNTAVGSVVLDRAIGVDYSFVDKPMPLAMNMILAEIPGKIKKYEPRCTLTDISFNGDQLQLEAGQLLCRITVSIP
jgi:uncharacterized protein